MKHEDLEDYANKTAADSDVDYLTAVRMMRDEAGEVARETGHRYQLIIDWCREQEDLHSEVRT
jgi:hypothetical protein